MRALCLLCCLIACLGLAVGCGTGGPSTQGTVALPPIRGPKPPKGASPLLRQAYRNFQPPLADPEVKGSAKAIKAGEAACKGKTPLEAKEEFISRSDLSAAQRESLQAIEAAEAHPSADFVAGQLAALAYEGTLEGALAQYGYRGCVYALAEGLKGELAKNSRSDP